MPTVEFKYENGIKVKDRVSGLAGVIVGQSHYLNKCNRYIVQPPVSDKEPGKLPEAFYIDEDQIDVLDAETVLPAEKMRRSGPPVERAPRL
jgi:hypothetical protein